MCLLRQGRSDEARGDMQLGASVEAQRPGRFGVGAALERVQGPERLMLEQYRRAGQLAAAQMRLQTNQARFEQIQSREAEALDRKAVIPLSSLLRSDGARPEVVYESSPRPRTELNPVSPLAQPVGPIAGNGADPFRDDASAAARPTTAGPAAAATPAVPPAGEASTRVSGPPAAGDNPFGAAAASPPAPTTASPVATPSPTTSPGNASRPEDDNPFGTAAPSRPVRPITPPATVPPAAAPDDDPFRSP